MTLPNYPLIHRCSPCLIVAVGLGILVVGLGILVSGCTDPDLAPPPITVEYLANPERVGVGFAPSDDSEAALERYGDEVGECVSVISGSETCIDAGCDAVAACCIANSECCSDAVGAQANFDLDFTSCVSEVIANCTAPTVAVVSGSGDPLVNARGMTLQGSIGEDTRVLFDDAFNLGSHAVSVEIDYVSGDGCGVGCIDFVGVGFARESLYTLTSSNIPVGVVFGSGRRHAFLVVNGINLYSLPIPDGRSSWTLTVSPEGLATLEQGTDSVASEFSPEGFEIVTLAAFGRGSSTSNALGAIASIASSRSLCDFPLN